MPTPDDADSNPSQKDPRGVPEKAPIDQWLAGDLSTTDIIDNVLGFFGITMKSPRPRDEEDDEKRV